MKFDIESLNQEQLDAMNSVDGAVLVTAGAGSGKTRLLTHRIVHLIKDLHIPPENILAITFTNKATNEMKTRVIDMLPEGKDVWISTFHSMCVRILRTFINIVDPRYNSNFSIYAETEISKIINELMLKHDIKKDENFKRTILFHMSNCKNGKDTLEQYHLKNEHYPNINLIMTIFKEYQEKLAENNAVDFDDLMRLTYNLFKNNPLILEKYAKRFRYILVDEFQDTNEIQYELIKMLSGYHKNIFVVGDEDQCIYTWRGANFENIFRFKKEFQNVKIFKLEQNYRSSKVILDCANKLIKNNKQRIDKKLWSNIETTYPIERRELYDEQEEADFIARTIHNLVQNQGFEYKDFAILLRLNALSLPFEEKLLLYNIPHKIYGGFKFFERAEIKNVLAYLKLIVNQKDDQAFERIINFPKRGIGEVALKTIKDKSKELNQSMLEICLNSENHLLPSTITSKLNNFIEVYKELYKEYEITPLEEFVNNVIKKFKIIENYNTQIETDLDKILNIQQLVSAISSFSNKNEGVTLSDYLQSVSLVSDIDAMDNSENNIIIATVHAVKGLEFRVVFVVGLEEKIFPISRAFNSNEEMEEERRLMYVAITRAKERLFFTNCKTRYLYGHRDYMLQSRFLNELGYGKQTEGKSSYSQPLYNNFISRKTNSQVDFVKKSLNSEFKKEENSIKYNNNWAKSFNNLGLIGNKDISKYCVGNVVLHTKFGMGIIKSIDNDSKTADIDFDKIGVKTLMLEIAPLKIIKTN